MATSAWYESVNAAELGRLFFTPLQRQQLEFQDASSNSSVEGSGRRNYIIVNGVVQKQGGNRTAWVNGTAQAAGRSNDKSPASISISVPGKSQPVQTKVGQKILLEAAPPEPAPEENK